VVNKQQSDAAETAGIPFIAVNVGVSLSLSMPSVAAQIADALVRGRLAVQGFRQHLTPPCMPFACLSFCASSSRFRRAPPCSAGPGSAFRQPHNGWRQVRIPQPSTLL